MTKLHSGVLIDVPYQGNGWWLVAVLGSLFMLYRIFSEYKSKRKAGLQVDPRAVIFACIFYLGFFGVALFQVLTHR